MTLRKNYDKITTTDSGINIDGRVTADELSIGGRYEIVDVDHVDTGGSIVTDMSESLKYSRGGNWDRVIVYYAYGALDDGSELRVTTSGVNAGEYFYTDVTNNTTSTSQNYWVVAVGPNGNRGYNGELWGGESGFSTFGQRATYSATSTNDFDPSQCMWVGGASQGGWGDQITFEVPSGVSVELQATAVWLNGSLL